VTLDAVMQMRSAAAAMTDAAAAMMDVGAKADRTRNGEEANRDQGA
jgi:hypothetical protein